MRSFTDSTLWDVIDRMLSRQCRTQTCGEGACPRSTAQQS